jgi:hypothetical protein
MEARSPYRKPPPVVSISFVNFYLLKTLSSAPGHVLDWLVVLRVLGATSCDTPESVLDHGHFNKKMNYIL